MIEEVRARLARLTSRERQVMQLDAALLSGKDRVSRLNDSGRGLRERPVSPENVIRSIPLWLGATCQRSDLAQRVRNLPTPRGDRLTTHVPNPETAHDHGR